jgi:hypothetical protein
VPAASPRPAVGDPGSPASSHEAPRSRIAIARRDGDDLGLPSLPPTRRNSAPTAQDDRSAAPPAGTRSAIDVRTGGAPAAAPIRDDARRSLAASTAPTAQPSAPTPPAPAAQPSAPAPPAPAAPVAVATAPAIARADTARATGDAAPASRETHRTASPPPLLGGMRVATIVDAGATPLAIADRPAPRRTIHREVRVGDIVVELGEALPSREAVERAGTLTAAIPHRAGAFDHTAASRHSLLPRRRL